MEDVSQKKTQYEIEKKIEDIVPILNSAFNKAGQSGTVRTILAVMPSQGGDIRKMGAARVSELS